MQAVKDTQTIIDSPLTSHFRPSPPPPPLLRLTHPHAGR